MMPRPTGKTAFLSGRVADSAPPPHKRAAKKTIESETTVIPDDVDISELVDELNADGVYVGSLGDKYPLSLIHI